MKKLLALAAFALILSCSNGRYSRNDLQLVAAYQAREMCSCLYVMEQDESWCRAWTRASPNVAKFEIDNAKKRVTASAVTLWGSTAKFVSARSGCVTE